MGAQNDLGVRCKYKTLLCPKSDSQICVSDLGCKSGKNCSSKYQEWAVVGYFLKGDSPQIDHVTCPYKNRSPSSFRAPMNGVFLSLPV